MNNNILTWYFLSSSISSFLLSSVPFVVNFPKPRRRVSKPRKLHRCALLEPIRSIMHTPWDRLLSCGVEKSFDTSVNMPKVDMTLNFLPCFKRQLNARPYYSPYHKTNCRQGRKPFLHPLDVLGLAFWYRLTYRQRRFNGQLRLI